MSNDHARVCYVCGEEVVPWRCEDCDGPKGERGPKVTLACVEHHRHTAAPKIAAYLNEPIVITAEDIRAAERAPPPSYRESAVLRWMENDTRRRRNARELEEIGADIEEALTGKRPPPKDDGPRYWHVPVGRIG